MTTFIGLHTPNLSSLIRNLSNNMRMLCFMTSCTKLHLTLTYISPIGLQAFHTNHFFDWVPCGVYPNHACRHFPHNIGTPLISFSLSKWRFSCSLNGNIDSSPCLTVTLTIEPRTVEKIWARSPISLNRMSFWCLFLEPHTTQIQVSMYDE